MKILDVFGKGKKAKNQKETKNSVADEAPEYQLPYFLDDDKKKKTKKAPDKKADAIQVEAPEVAEKKPAAKKAEAPKADDKKPVAKKTETPKAEDKKPTAKKADTPKAEDKKPVAKKDAIKELNDSDMEIVESKSQKNGKFEIKKSKDGRFVFNLYASNNVIVATSQVYTSSASAVNGINSVIANAATSPVEDQTMKNYATLPYPKWEIYRDKGDQFRFRLCASNGSCVCHSQGYTSKANCKNGIESIIKFASGANISKSYLEKKDK